MQAKRTKEDFMVPHYAHVVFVAVFQLMLSVRRQLSDTFQLTIVQ